MNDQQVFWTSYRSGGAKNGSEDGPARRSHREFFTLHYPGTQFVLTSGYSHLSPGPISSPPHRLSYIHIAEQHLSHATLLKRIELKYDGCTYANIISNNNGGHSYKASLLSLYSITTLAFFIPLNHSH